MISSIYESDCCGAPVYDDSDICSDCKEHCTVLEPCETCKGTGQVKIVLAEHWGIQKSDTIEFTACPDCEEGYREVDL